MPVVTAETSPAAWNGFNDTVLKIVKVSEKLPFPPELDDAF